MPHTPVLALPEGSVDSLIIDRCLPDFDARLLEHTVVDADHGATWQALCDLDLMQVHTRLLDAAFWVRGLPARLRHTDVPPPATLRLGDAETGRPLPGWVSLGIAPRHEIALGAVGRFWTPSIEWHDVSAAEFPTFAEPGWGRIVASFSLRGYGDRRTLATYECRTAVPDAESRKAFLRYWTLIRPFVGHIMRATLQSLATNAGGTMNRSAFPG
jgi:hypothetical protein